MTERRLIRRVIQTLVFRRHVVDASFLPSTLHVRTFAGIVLSADLRFEQELATFGKVFRWSLLSLSMVDMVSMVWGRI